MTRYVNRSVPEPPALPAELLPGQRACETCGTGFTPRSGAHKYCQASCRPSSDDSQERGSCGNCGLPLDGRNKSGFCSRDGGVCSRVGQEHKDRMAAYYQEHRDEYRARERAYGRAAKDAVFAHYGGACQCPPEDGPCGVSEPAFLTLGHPDGDGGEHRRKLGKKGVGTKFYYRLLRDDFKCVYQL